jgi:hypothetical protein
VNVTQNGLHITKLSFFGGKPALRDVSFKLEKRVFPVNLD